MTDAIRVLIAEDHTIVRAGVRLLLDIEADIDVVGEATTGREAVEMTAALRPDVVLMDIGMPVMDGMEATRIIKRDFEETQILVLTMHRADEYLFEMLRAGASGYVIKGAETDELINAVRVVARGEVFLYPAMAGKLVREFIDLSTPRPETGPALSPREKEILALLVDGYSNKEIAAKLVVSLSTVHSHRSRLMQRLGLTGRHELIQYAREKGILRDI